MYAEILEHRVCLDCTAPITFSVGQAPAEVAQEDFDAAIDAAVAAWDAVGKVQRVDAPGQDFLIQFNTVDGPGNLISTFDERTVTLDSEEPWEFGDNNTLQFDMARSIAHEIGHVAFGLEHSDEPTDVMYPFQTELDALDNSTPEPVPEPEPIPEPTPEPIPDPTDGMCETGMV